LIIKEKSCGCRNSKDEFIIKKALQEELEVKGKVKTKSFANLFNEEIPKIIRDFLRNSSFEDEVVANKLNWSKDLKGKF
jgi:hypothetical protein